MYRTTVASLRLAAPRRTLYATPAARKDINHKVGDTLAAGESCFGCSRRAEGDRKPCSSADPEL